LETVRKANLRKEVRIVII